MLAFLLLNWIRHKTNMGVLREVLPPDMLDYCEKHCLLDGVLGNETEAASPEEPSS
jgi:hypothetical protein